MAGVNEVTDSNFQAEVIESDQPVLVDFWAPWCGPCRMVAPIVEEIAGERPELKVVKLNTDENIQTASEYQILAIPTLLLFRNGQVAKRIQGAMPKKRLEQRDRARPASRVGCAAWSPGPPSTSASRSPAPPPPSPWWRCSARPGCARRARTRSTPASTASRSSSRPCGLAALPRACSRRSGGAAASACVRCCSAPC